jgi:hypothetical protein
LTWQRVDETKKRDTCCGRRRSCMSQELFSTHGQASAPHLYPGVWYSSHNVERRTATTRWSLPFRVWSLELLGRRQPARCDIACTPPAWTLADISLSFRIARLAVKGYLHIRDLAYSTASLSFTVAPWSRHIVNHARTCYYCCSTAQSILTKAN